MEKILLGHGSGGRLMHKLIREHFAPQFDLKELHDSAVLNLQKSKIAFTTDSYVVSPIFFPGGNIGSLAVNGTVNDLAMVGAMPLFLSASFIIEEGFPIDDLNVIISSMSEAAKIAEVKVVTGDTKVVDKGKGDGIFITTSGIGIVPEGVDLSPKNIKPGDKVIVSGQIGNHAVSVLAKRMGLHFEHPVLSDTAPLNSLVKAMLQSVSTQMSEIRVMRDPTRGGIATTLKEIAIDSGLCIRIDENLLPISSKVLGACELLGLDPLYLANEGILIAIVSPNSVESLIEKMRAHPLGRNTTVIGEVSDSNLRSNGMVLLKTSIGGIRIIEMLSQEQLPRIC